MSTLAGSPIAHTDATNAKILSISEDRIQGFVRDPIGEIAERSGVDVDTVIERIRAMLRAGTIRRVRQTLMATNLAEGALVAWQFPPDRVDAAFDYMSQQDPFSGHVVIRSTDAATPGSNYRLWTTVKVPQGFSIRAHCAALARITGAQHFRVMPAERIFALGVGHVRRKEIEPGSKSVGSPAARGTSARPGVRARARRCGASVRLAGCPPGVAGPSGCGSRAGRRMPARSALPARRR